MRWYDLILLTIFLWFSWHTLTGNVDVARALLPVVAGVSATLLGFLVTALSILMTLSGQRLIENMRRTGHLRRMVRNFFSAGVAFLITLIFSLISMMIKDDMSHYGGVAAAGLLFLSLHFFIIGGYNFYQIVDHISSKPTDS